MQMISFEGVRKAFGRAKVLDDFNFLVSRGEKVALIGPSGSGKSTILRMIMALQDIDHGKVSIAGKPLWHVQNGSHLVKPSPKHFREMRKLTGMVFQSFNLFPNMTALGNVAAAPRYVLNLPKVEAEELAAHLLGQVGLADKLSNYPATMSGGQQQRVAIARAMALDPKVMLFDEATSALDPERVGEVLEVMRELAHTRDLTMIVVTHQMGVANAIADRICFMEGGKVVEEGEPEQILNAPSNERTRDFLRAVHLS